MNVNIMLTKQMMPCFEARSDLESPASSGACILTDLLDIMVRIWIKLMKFQSNYMGIICYE